MTRWRIIALTCLACSLLSALAIGFGRPTRTATTFTVQPGITYERRATNSPRPMMTHIARIELDTPQLRLLVTPGIAADSGEFSARTTSEFAHEFGVQFAVNGSFFHPAYSNNPVDYYPYSGDPIKTRGLIISNGTRYALNKNDYPVICIHEQGQAEYQPLDCPPSTVQAIFGNVVLVENGLKPDFPAELYFTEPRPRTVIALDETGYTMWLIVVDGRQPYYSEGATLIEMAELVVSLGGHVALNLDGGGSSAMVMARDGDVEPLNVPIHTRVPMRERPVATHIGVYAEP